MKRSRVVHLVGAFMTALYLLASSPAAAQYKLVPLSDENAIQVGGTATPSATAFSASTFSAATITADISACLGGAGPFAILGFQGPPNTTQVFKVTQTAPGVLAFSNTEAGQFTETIDILVPLDGNGNGESAPFYMKAIGLGQTVVSICNDQQRCAWDQATAIVVNVASVEWEAIDSPLDANPNAGGGQRIFPDKASPGDTTADKTLVTIKVMLSAEHSRLVGVKAFDVDDPSSDADPVDKTGSAGNDNRGTTPSLGTTGEGFGNGTTGPDGVARFTFKVSKQPGDNFRVAAACHLVHRDGLTADGVGIKESSGRPLPTEFAKMAPLLTTWRRLHLEVDSMGPVQGNFVEGTVTKARATSKGTTILTLLDPLADYKRFEKGRITIENVGAYPVVASRGSTVTVQGEIAQNPAGQRFKLVDDDDFNEDDGDELDGDEGEDLPAPDLSLVQESDLPAENVFAPAYVKPTYDLGALNPHPEAPFVLNSGPDVSYDYFDNRSSVNDTNFWTAYLLGAYQYATSDDRDGETTATFGLGSVWGANIYLEVGRSWEERTYANKAAFVNQAATTAHELGHWFGASDDDGRSDPEGGLMCWPPDRKKGTFSDKTLAIIRSKFLP